MREGLSPTPRGAGRPARALEPWRATLEQPHGSGAGNKKLSFVYHSLFSDCASLFRAKKMETHTLPPRPRSQSRATRTRYHSPPEGEPEPEPLLS